MIKGKNYKERSRNQLDMWAKGDPVHNNIDDECCPDFSCCNKSLLASKKEREKFHNGSDNLKSKMLGEFLERFLSSRFTDGKIYISS